ncbi:DUF6993 domain-containing protein [Arthrobacter sp. ISL-69]|uniref:DUF6993 domain-containing protein n=1 Tax=Arthrobacter sp. ISL-69 TaxID=2819113 RepID=UPI00288AFF82|nr:hypothetical protein [Arthrobacter sp. ISL-69]
MIRAETPRHQSGIRQSENQQSQNRQSGKQQPGKPLAGNLRRPRIRTAPVLLIAASVLVAGLAGCTGADSVPSAPSSQAAAAAVETPSAQPSSSAADGSASSPAADQPELDAATARLSETVGNALRGVVASNPKPGQEQLTAALTGAGIPAGSLQVSASRTPTGLEVDAIEAAALQGEACVIGQIRDGSVVVTVLPVLATGKCFVGG